MKVSKAIKFPQEMVTGYCPASSLVLDGGSVIDQCVATAGERGTFFLQQHLIYVVLGGVATLRSGRHKWTVRKNEMVLLRKAQSIKYEKHGNGDNEMFESLLFAVTDRMLSEFLTTQHVQMPPEVEETGVRVCPISERLEAYCKSLFPYFEAPERTNQGLLRLKMMEFLYNVQECSADTFRQMLRLRQLVKADIHRVVEENYTQPISLEELAYLSGRSLSSFKRDFQDIYGEPPARWIREKRLEKARQMLKNSGMSVADVAYSLGFGNPTHFSRIFRQQYNIAPSQIARE